MSRLNKLLNERDNAINRSNKPQKNYKIPEYNENGKVVRVGNEGLKKYLGIALIVLSSIFVIFYLPGFFMKDKNNIVNDYVSQPDVSSIKRVNDYYSKSKDKDFDGDGLNNSAEDEHGTNPWSKDTDNDGMDDYYEIYVSKTTPTEYDSNTLIELQNDYDTSAGSSVETPYKCSNVILWAKDINSKAYGGVIDTPKGYHFNMFNGYAQFPTGSGSFAYTTDNGHYELLPYDEDAKAWKINKIHNVELFNTEIDKVIEYKFFGKPVYASLNVFGKLMNFILPKKGIIAARLTTREDIEPTTTTYVTADNNNIHYDVENGDRFGQNTNSLQDLQFVRSMIDDNKCVEVSLYDVNDGEFRGIIYGYTNDNTLLVADETTLETVGNIYVDEIARKTVDKDGNYGLFTYFSWYGLGFSSSSYDRISFFSVAEEESEIISNQLPPDDATLTDAVETEATTEVTTEMVTEEIASNTDSKSEPTYDIEYIKDLKTGEWDHTLRGFETLLTSKKYEKDSSDEEDVVNKLIKKYSDKGISSYQSFISSDKNVIYTCIMVSEHDSATDLYKDLSDSFKEEAEKDSEKVKTNYLQLRYNYSDKSMNIIRRYADDVIVIVSSKNGMTDEIKEINKSLGTKKSD